ncbi:MAG: GvpL/GvpF family gas vesicle protein [Xanthomonadales bacterium]|nr:GvpL/GvpF family gas vesicle protein [Xanthomonadales bacterium]
MALILYGINRRGLDDSPSLTGLFGNPVRAVEVADFRVIVSDCSIAHVLPGQTNLADFQALLQQLTASADVLPMSFGMVAPDEETLRKELLPLRNRLCARLDAIADRVEFTVRLSWRGENLYSHFFENCSELRELCRQYLAAGRTPTASERIHLGQTLQRVLHAERRRCQQQLIDRLSDLCLDFATAVFDDERCWAKLALLVSRAQIDRLRAQAETLPDGAEADLVLELSAPYPPYRFVALGLE